MVSSLSPYLGHSWQYLERAHCIQRRRVSGTGGLLWYPVVTGADVVDNGFRSKSVLFAVFKGGVAPLLGPLGVDEKS